MAARRKNHEGKKYHHLTMIKPLRSGGAGRGMYWLAQCDCGATREVRASEASLGYIKTCGKCEYHLALLQGAGSRGGQRYSQLTSTNKGLRLQEHRYIKSAATRKIPWNLTPQQFNEIVKQNCTYCQAPPREYKQRDKKGRGRVRIAVMNGIDRVDSSKGYTLDNCIPCCTTCNRMKLDLPIVDFIKQCTRISVLFDKYMKVLKETAEAEGQEDIGEYDQLYKDLLAIQYGYRHSPIRHEISTVEINAMHVELTQLLPNTKKRLSKTSQSSAIDMRIDNESNLPEGQELLDGITELLKQSNETDAPDLTIENFDYAKYGKHALRIAQVAVAELRGIDQFTHEE